MKRTILLLLLILMGVIACETDELRGKFNVPPAPIGADGRPYCWRADENIVSLANVFDCADSIEEPTPALTTLITAAKQIKEYVDSTH